jgi:hypothetical protein
MSVAHDPNPNFYIDIQEILVYHQQELKTVIQVVNLNFDLAVQTRSN